MILADDLCVGESANVMAQMVRIFEKYHCSIVEVEELPIEEASKYGIISGQPLENNCIRVERMMEKPAPQYAPSNPAIIGRYILAPDIFDILRNTPPGRNGEVQITDALQAQVASGMIIATFSPLPRRHQPWPCVARFSGSRRWGDRFRRGCRC